MMKKLLYFVLLFVTCCTDEQQNFKMILTPDEQQNLKKIFGIGDPDVHRNVTQMISSKGYPVEDHWLFTDDGYILSVQHIPHGRNNSGSGSDKRTVLLVHGLFGTAENFVFDFPEESLGFILADKGYDVWLGNIRGTTYSKRHSNYTRRNPEFWDFTFQDIAEHDLPALIDFVLAKTGRPTLSYVGHSQGTMAAFAMLSERPKYNEKINIFVGLAPAAHLGNMPPGLNRVLFTLIYLLGPLLGHHELYGNNYLLLLLKEMFCNSVLAPVCRGFFYELLGEDNQLNRTRMPVYLGHFPDSTSTKNLFHLSQLVVEGTFRKFDYGSEDNILHYNQPTPPHFDLTRITAPVALIWSEADGLADPRDVNILRHKLRNLVGDYEVPYDNFGHIDFIIALQANKLVYDYVLGLLEKV